MTVETLGEVHGHDDAQIPRKLIDAEPFLEHGRALALTLMDAVALAPALEHGNP